MLQEYKVKKSDSNSPILHFQRYEFKYHIPLNIADKILPALLNHMCFDPNVYGQGNFYEVHSIYLDSPEFKNYHEKVEGELFRKKLRIRSYAKDVEGEGRVFLEIKRKYNMIIIKDRIGLSLNDAERLCSGRVGNLSEKSKSSVIGEFLMDKTMYAMRPKALVSYKRKPLVSKVGMNLRVTFDYDIAAARVTSLDFSKKVRPVYDGMCVLEVKFNDILPYWLHNVIQKYQLEAWPYSKYCFGVENSYLNIAND